MGSSYSHISLPGAYGRYPDVSEDCLEFKCPYGAYFDPCGAYKQTGYEV